jgi:DNA-binding response OmpR family regulator
LDPAAGLTLLVVEDEDRIASFLLKGLRAAGFEVKRVVTGAEALERVRRNGPDLMILDLGLPDVDGFEVLREMRARGDETPVVVLTARGGVPDRVEGLELGADDYLAKPFAFDELLARVRARLRTKPPTVLEAGNVEVDLIARTVRSGDRTVDLTAREFTLLETLMRRPGKTLTREELLSEVWGLEFDPRSNLVDVYVGYLRKKVGEDLIETVRGVGYRLSPPAQAQVRRTV